MIIPIAAPINVAPSNTPVITLSTTRAVHIKKTVKSKHFTDSINMSK